MAKYVVTGGAGFIGSNISEYLLLKGEEVTVLDNLSTGKQQNIDEIKGLGSFNFIKGDIRNYDDCVNACNGADYVIHCAAWGSVPRSVAEPLAYNENNISGTLNMLEAARHAKVKRFVYSASSSAYGDTPTLPKIETMNVNPKSPYAITKLVGEQYARVYNDIYGLQTVALRYFNVFGKRQDPFSQYAAVIPIFVSKLLKGESPTINGDGEQTRDFTFIENVVQANVKACLAPDSACGKVYNIGYGQRISLNQLYNKIKELLTSDVTPDYGPSRVGDVKDSLASIEEAKSNINYDPKFDIFKGLEKAIDWYKNNL